MTVRRKIIFGEGARIQRKSSNVFFDFISNAGFSENLLSAPVHNL